MSNHDNQVCPTFVLKHASVTDLGMRRSNNQDSLAVYVTDDVPTWVSRGHLLMVADGMGAHAAGELASKLAVDNIPHNYFKLRDLYPPAALRQAIRDANNAIHAKGQSSIGFQGMGTTCSCLVLLPQGALVAHIGDSRVYRLRGELLEQLTFDHSLVWEMAAAGQMSEADVPAYIPKNVITRSLGPHPTVHVDVEGPFDAQTGDVFLICSDGLSGPVKDEEIGTIMRCLDPQDAVDTLVDLANLRGGPDNISAVIAKIDGVVPRTSALESGPEPPAPQRSPAGPIWVAAGACLAMLGYSAFHQYWFAAIGSAIGFVAAVIAGLVNRGAPANRSASIRSLGGPYGNGPYRKISCAPNEKVVVTLDEILQKLRNLPENERGDGNVDWKAFDSERDAAKGAAGRSDYSGAVKHSCAAIRGVMRQLRNCRPTIDHDENRI